MPKVVFFKETLLPQSETFILDQMRALTGYLPIVAGLERVRPSLPLPQEPLLLSTHGSLISDVRAKLYRRSGIAPLFHHRLKKSRPNLVHAHFASGGLSALPLARALGVPLIVTLYGHDVTVRGLREDVYKRLSEQASLFLCVSQFIRDRALAAGFPLQKLRVHYLGIDRTRFSPLSSPEPSQNVLFVGRLVEKKGCEYLLRAMHLVQRAYPHSELTVIGDGPLRLRLEAIAIELNLRCQFRGSQPAPVILAALQKTRIFCAPSLTAANGDSEGLGVVFGEAQAMGVPIISTQHGGIPEIVADRVTGLLVPERDHKGLADAICLLLADENLWERLHSAGPKRIEQRFDLQMQTALLEDIYDGVTKTVNQRVPAETNQSSCIL
jgi:colanic acid/amylovoran biosynthesis glycosyltransferase